MKPLTLFFFVLFFMIHSASAQLSTDLSAQEIFEKVVQYYDPNGVWGEFSGSMHMYTIFGNGMGEEDLTIENTKDFYRSIKYLPDGVYAKGVKDGQVFFEADGRALKPDQISEKLQKGPYGLNEHGTRAFKEHHTIQFSMPLSLYAAGAQPLPEISLETLFGAECLAIKFADFRG